jgi:6-phosphogluconolactonase/glucosamine-6-phosphate isomerase/deaminase
MTPDIIVLSDLTALTREAADRFITLARSAIAAQGRFTVALSGGSTPRLLYGERWSRSRSNGSACTSSGAMSAASHRSTLTAITA